MVRDVVKVDSNCIYFVEFNGLHSNLNEFFILGAVVARF